MADVTYRFLPWVREGLAAQIRTPDTRGAGVPGRARLDVETTVTRRSGAAVIEVPRRIVVSGPGDVVGIDRRQVIRTDPKPNATDFEPNFLVQLEFDRPDFPWLFTPAAANGDDQLRPWLVLVVVTVSDDVTLRPEPDAKLSVLTIPSSARPSRQLPDLKDSWAWAHAQLVTTGSEALEDVLAGRPERTASRLICPRRLDPDTNYHACVVPAFEAGRLAGLGTQPDGDAILRPAWSVASNATVKLPVYYAWQFRTGAGGDFESLAERLRARPIPPDVGRHDVFVGAAGPPLPELPPDGPGAVVPLRGALVPPEQPAPAWPLATRKQVQDGLRKVLDVPAQRLGAGGAAPEGAVVTPPLYGRWLAAQRTVPKTAGPRWMRTLNLDPRNRAISGLATRVVQAEQERLMEQAWAQVGEIEKANRELRWAQVATEVRSVLLRKHAAPLPPGSLLQLTQTAHRRMLIDTTTVWSAARESALPEATLSAPFQRAARPRGPLARRAYAPRDRVIRPIVEGLDAGRLAAAPPDRPPDGLFGFVETRPARPGLPAEAVTRIRAAAMAASTQPPRVVTPEQVRRVAATDDIARDVADRLRAATSGSRPERFGGTIATTSTPTTTAAPTRTTTASRTTRLRSPMTLPETLPVTLSGEVLVRVRRIVTAFHELTATTIEHIDRVADEPRPPTPSPLGVATLRGQVLVRLDPLDTIRARVERRIAIPDRLRPVPPKHPLDEVLAVPVFPQPAWELLRDRFPEHLLPGLERVLVNSVSLMQTNQGFVEAFLVGLNHEFARELLWREYPTDQRGTAFRRFWAPGGRDDIPDIHTWERPSDLGATMLGGPDGHLVLLVRGDLLRRYPSTVIYAAPDANGTADLSAGTIQIPLFRGRMDPDVTFVGFDLTATDARDRWWFVFEEQPTEPRFALDIEDGFGAEAAALNQWNDLSWGHLATGLAELAALSHIPLTDLPAPHVPPPAPTWGESASAMAAILVQQPVRVLFRGADLLAEP